MYSIWFPLYTSKGQSNEIFDLQIFSSFKPAWATGQWFKLFSIFVKISMSYSNFSVEKTYSSQYHIAGEAKQNGPRTFLQKYKCSPFLVE